LFLHAPLKFVKTKINLRLVILLLLFCLSIVETFAQESFQTIKFDTIVLKKGYVLTVYNRSYISHNDTTLYISSGVPYKINKKKNNIFDKLDSTAQYNKLTRELRNLILVKPKPHVTIETNATIKSESNFISQKDKVIRNISFNQLDVFGPTVDDTTIKATHWVERAGNKVHFKTKPYLLHNNLIINSGERLDPLKLADNERLLRETSYLHDAKIYLKDVGANSDSVDVYIVTKDVWPRTFDLRVNSFHGGSLSLWDRNILGLGHEIQNTVFWDGNEKEAWGYEGNYSVPNIGGTFIRGRARYLDKFGNKTYGVSFDRSFFTPNIKYAGGLSVYKTLTYDYFEYTDTTLFSPVEFVKSDIWLGRSFSLNSNLLSKFQSRNNISFILRVTKNDIKERPEVGAEQFYKYHNRTLYLSSIAYTKQNFFKSNLIYNFGKTEDIPYGLQIQFSGGYETNEYKNRAFLASKFAWALYKPKFGYIYYSIGHEGFINSEKKIEQGMVISTFNYFTPLFSYKKFKFRHFLYSNYTKGINRYKDEFLTINEDYGLKGFVNDSLRGNERLNLQLESVCFTPWYFHGFRFTFFASAEFSLFGRNIDLWKNPLYSGLSLGIRIKNERLVFNTIEFRFHFYPNIKQYSNAQLFNLSGEHVLTPPNFSTLAPEVSTFR
jgi:hypothetical protein